MRWLGPALVALACSATALAAQVRPYSLVIRGGTVVDGTGAAPYRADVAISGDRIARIAPDGIDPALAERIIDARGLVVAPGFIDVHAHVEDLAERPLAESFLRQGVTTVLYAADGGMPASLPDAIARLERGGIAPNTAFLVGFNALRVRVLGSADRAPTPAELGRMQQLAAESMAEGALGISTGLRYVPGSFATTEEVIAVAKVVAARGGFYISHIRDEGAGSLAAVRELIRIAREADLPAQVSHHKLMGQPQWGQSVHTLALIDSARAAGLDITIDQYPYDATSTGTAVLFPGWSLAGGLDSLRARLADPAQRARIEQGIRETIVEERGGGDLARIRLARVGWRPEWNGWTFADIARARGRTADLDFAVELAIEIQARGGASGVWHVVDEADIRRIMTHPATMFSSDGGIGVPGHGMPHPRGYGAFARVLARYVREQQVLTLPDAVRRMTSMSADRLGQRERGRIAEGTFADVAIFDPDRIQDRSTYEDPHQFAVGVEYVLVNGVPVLWHGSLTGEKPGRVLKRTPR